MAKRKSKAPRSGKVKIEVVNLKKPGLINVKDPGTATAQLKAVLKKASRKSIGFVVLNAPFKLRRTAAV
jgi:hypothetical protein